MAKGKKKCNALRELRMKIAKANDIEYTPVECAHKGDCAGTCPLCEQELAELTKKLRERQDKGENVELKGIAKDEKFFDIALEEGITAAAEELVDGMVILSEIDETDTLMGEMPMINVLDKNVKAKKR